MTPPPSNPQSRASTSAETKESGQESLTQRVIGEFEKYAVISVYLWMFFAAFGLYKRELLHQQDDSLWQQGFAILNALIFGKVLLIAQALKLGKRLERLAPVWSVLGKSLIFAILLIVFHLAEEAIRLWFKGQPVSTAFAEFAGTPFGLWTYAAIFFVVLIPLLAFQEAARILGSGPLWHLFLRGNRKRFRLIEEQSQPSQGEATPR